MSPYSIAVVSLIIGNLMASLSDVAVKLLDGDIPSFQYVFIRQLLALLVLTPLYYYNSRGVRFSDQVSDWKVNAIRGQLIVIGAACMVVAVTHLPLATANAVFYAAPLIMLPLSVWFLKESPRLSKVVATTIGFIGVLIVLRPSHFHWAALFALGTATTLAFFHILVKKIPSRSSVVHTLFWTSLFSLPASGLIAFSVWQTMTYTQTTWILFSSLSVLAYNGLAVYAYKKVEANQVALAEYSGLLFVTLFGVWWFDEIPDALTLQGVALIVLPIIPRGNWKKLMKSIG